MILQIHPHGILLFSTMDGCQRVRVTKLKLLHAGDASKVRLGVGEGIPAELFKYLVVLSL